MQATVDELTASSGSSTGDIPSVETYADLPTTVEGVKLYAVMDDETNDHKTSFYALYGTTKQWLFSQDV